MAADKSDKAKALDLALSHIEYQLQIGDFMKNILIAILFALTSTAVNAGPPSPKNLRIVSSNPSQSSDINYYASPSGSGTTCSSNAPCSLTGAQAKVRTLNTGTMTGDIIVNLQGGTYTLGSTFQLTEADSGNSGYKVIYQNDSGATPIISGGTQITGWTNDGNGIWQASVSPSLRFRQLYVNGTRAIRARQPNVTDSATGGPFYSSPSGMSQTPPYTYGVDPSELANWKNLNEVELVINEHWFHKRARIAGFNGGEISFISPESTERVMPFFSFPSPHFYENAYEFLDAEGEFYLNTQTNILYYKPRSGETMSSATVIAPNLENLVTVTGVSTANMAHDIKISGITFDYSNWTLPNRSGYLNWQAGAQIRDELGGWVDVPGAIQLRNADAITISNNTIRHTGAHGITLLDDTKNCIFDHNTITDTSSGGIFLTLWNSNSSSNRVTNNIITDGGREYSDTIGIFLALTPYAVVNHNEVGRYRYTGISVGYQWDDNDTAATNIEIGYNYVHDVMQMHDDGAGIYTLGKIPNMNIHDNYVKNSVDTWIAGGFGGHGIYLDQGSTGKTVQNNVIDNATDTFFANNWPTYGNIFQNNFSNNPLGHVDTTNNQVINHTDVSGSNWPSAAQAIISSAGTGGGPLTLATASVTPVRK
jgi:parallel beta-helix repeat protein